MTRSPVSFEAPAPAAAPGAAERRRAARRQLRREVTEAIGKEGEVSTAALLKVLQQSLRTLETRSRAAQHGPARNAARRVVGELVKRYAIELDR